MIRVLVVDDHDVTREGLRAALSDAADIEVVGEAASGEEAITAVERMEPDVVFMDLRMSGIGGIEATKRIRQRHPEAKIIIFTVDDSAAIVDEAVKAGVSGYLLKDIGVDDLVAVTRFASEGKRVIDPRVIRADLPWERHVPEPPSLSRDEIQVLSEVANGTTREQAADRLGMAREHLKGVLDRISQKLWIARQRWLRLPSRREYLLDVFERFTERARRVVVLAQEEARMLNHNYIGTEHVLLGLIHEGEGVAAQALEGVGIDLGAVRFQVKEIIGEGQSAPTGHIPFTPRAKKVLELSLREALNLGHNYIGTEHILLGLVREGEGVAAQVLEKLGANLVLLRQEVIKLLSGYTGGEVEGLELSEEEIEVLAGIAEGSTRKQIAEKLGLSRDELRSRIDKVLERLRSRSRGTRVEQTHDAPRCPRCRSEIGEMGAVVALDLPVQGTDDTRAISFAFCRRCGTWLGAA